jgi:hypothetical protein
VLCSCTISEVLFGLLNSICLSSPDCCRGSLVSRFAFPLPPALAPRVLSFPVLSLCSQIVLPLQDRVVFLLVASCQIRLTVFGLAECADQIHSLSLLPRWCVRSVNSVVGSVTKERTAPTDFSLLFLLCLWRRVFRAGSFSLARFLRDRGSCSIHRFSVPAHFSRSACLASASPGSSPRPDSHSSALAFVLRC